MKIGFYGADHEVTGSCHFLEAGGVNMLVDCGMEQGASIYENQVVPVNAKDIKYVFVTHAHIDHSGLLPLLYKEGFKGTVFATVATSQLCEIMLKDSAFIQESEAEWKSRKALRKGLPPVEPMYDHQDAEGVLELFAPCAYNEKISLDEHVAIRFVNAGHLLGSSSIEIWLREGENEVKLAFSGDIGVPTRPLIKSPEYIWNADYVIMESTYGNREHEEEGTDFVDLLAETINTTLGRGGNVVIPAFSVGRTQEVLYFIRQIKEKNLCPGLGNFPVYMDSPLAVEATTIFRENVSECFDEEAKALVMSGKNPIGFDGLKVAVSSDESKAINFDDTPKVIISASGMCEAGRIRHHLKHNLWRKESTVIFVGYQVPGTLGNMLLNGIETVKLFGEPVTVHAEIKKLPGMSGHGDHNDLINWVKAIEGDVKKVFIVHGDDAVVDTFAAEVEAVTGHSSYAPYSGDMFDLLTGEQVAYGSKEKIKKQKATEAESVFARLLAAGERLLRVIKNSKGLTNKDLTKFASQVNNLADKWTNG